MTLIALNIRVIKVSLVIVLVRWLLHVLRVLDMIKDDLSGISIICSNELLVFDILLEEEWFYVKVIWCHCFWFIEL